MNLTSILSDLYRRLALPSVPNPTETTRLTSFINTTHRQILGLPGMESLRDDTLTLTSSVLTPTVWAHKQGLPGAVTRIEGITDLTTQRVLTLCSLKELRALDPGQTAMGIPERYVVRGYQQVMTQPYEANPLLVVSTSAADTAVVVCLEILRNNVAKSPFLINTTLNGTTPVTINPSQEDWADEVTKFYLVAPAAGDVSLYQTTVDPLRQLAQIGRGDTYARYLAIMLHPIPASVCTYQLDYVRTLVDLVQGTDEPLLPDDFHWLLVEGALLKEWTKRDDDRRVAAEREYAKGISALKYFVTCHADDLQVSGSTRPRESHSRFGGYYPSMRY